MRGWAQVGLGVVVLAANVLGCAKDGPVETVPDEVLGGVDPVEPRTERGTPDAGPARAGAERGETLARAVTRSSQLLANVSAGRAPAVARGSATVPPVVPSVALRGMRIAGETQIGPSEDVQRAMVASGTTQLRAAIELCLNETGEVEKARILRSTGFRVYDDRLLSAVSRWRYRPYLVNDEPARVCTTVRFRYELHPPEPAPSRGRAKQEEGV